MKKTAWAQNFIKNYSNKINPVNRANASNLSYAAIAFENKEYDRSLNYLMKVNYEDLLYKLEIKVLAIKINYELKHYDTVLDIIDSYRHLLVKKYIHGHFYQINMNFIKFMKRLVTLSGTSPKNGNTESLIKEILTTKELVSRDWLIEKVEKIKSRKP
jgi:hypothetical protein